MEENVNQFLFLIFLSGKEQFYYCYFIQGYNFVNESSYNSIVKVN